METSILWEVAKSRTSMCEKETKTSSVGKAMQQEVVYEASLVGKTTGKHIKNYKWRRI